MHKQLLHEINESYMKWNPSGIEFWVSLAMNHLKLDPKYNAYIKIQSKEEHQTLVEFNNAKNSGLTIDNYDFKELIRLVKPSRIIALFQALLLEKKVIMISKHHG